VFTFALVDFPSVQILGIRFFRGTASEAVTRICECGGMLFVPAAPALVRLECDEIYRNAVAAADMAIPDSGLMVLCWRIFRRERLNRISCLAYLKALIAQTSLELTMFVLPSETARAKLLVWSSAIRADDCHVAPMYDAFAQDRHLLALIEDRHPKHIVIAIGNGPQEKLGHFLRNNLSYGPAIHCIGAALGFLTGDQVAIPNWADKFYLGWLLRLIAQPRVFIPRLTRALKLPLLIFKYGEDLPPLRG
jgi:N-acetylglucosaminyldiphosphoundecaprenol N-acetyl-beta-D-mannosaminyltransferase